MFNIVVLHGRVSRAAVERTMPSGDRLVTLDLTVAAPEEGQRTESVPLAWFDPPKWVTGLHLGADVVVSGRVRRRFFQGGRGLESRTEVIVHAGAPAGRTARVAEIIRKAAAGMDPPPPTRP